MRPFRGRSDGASVVLVLAATVLGIVAAQRTINIDFGDAHRTTMQIIRKYGYPVESHKITTDDGYILSLFRIPYDKKENANKGRPVVLLAHGLMGTSADWVLLGPGFLLSDAGYDVWLLNSRGTRYSLGHRRYRSTGPSAWKYWNFSWHENGVYDVPAAIDYILKKTRQSQLIHVGHSQGGTAFYVMLSDRPEYNEKIKAHISYASAVFLCHLKSPLLRMAAIPERYGLLTELRNILGDLNAGPRLASLLIPLAGSLCVDQNGAADLCLQVTDIAFNLSPSQTSPSMTRILAGHYPGGGSTKQAVHYAQGIQKCEFRHYRETLRRTPAKYNLANVVAPIYAFYGQNDTLQDPMDAVLLGNSLPNGFTEGIQVNDWSHSDFVLGFDARIKVYDRTLAILNKL